VADSRQPLRSNAHGTGSNTRASNFLKHF
jgi:hypothetical protein